MKQFKVLSIDAWSGSEENSWEWNNWFTLTETYNEKEYGPLTEKSAMEFFKNEFITKGHEDEFEAEDDQYNLLLVKKGNRKPILAIEYGSGAYE